MIYALKTIAAWVGVTLFWLGLTLVIGIGSFALARALT